MARRIVWIALIIAAVAAAIGTLATSLVLCSSGAQSAARPGWDERWRNIDEAVGAGDLVGLARDDVVALYGEPMAAKELAGWDMVYRLGPARDSLSVQSEWLVLKLEAGKVTTSEIVKK